MKLTDQKLHAREPQMLRQVLRAMKFTMLLLLAGSMHVYADGFSESKISLRLQKADLKEALTLIEKQSGFRFLYSQHVLKNAGKVSVEAKNEALAKVLDELLEGTGISYKLLDDDLIVLNFDEEFFVPANVTVTGKVTDSSGNPIAGASVLVKGTKNGTSTDANGDYSITVADDATLIFSGIGFATSEEKVNSRTSISPALIVSEKKLDEVVVIGYGTASRRDLTGSITKVKGESIATQPNTNPLSSLQSKVAGLSIVNNAIPGSTPDVRIRGTISIGTVRPVYVIDGIFSDNMDFVNPNEVESIEILKDPSSLAVFGVKGAAGAILVTTKRAKAGKVDINLNSSYGIKTLVDKIKLANGDEFRQLLEFEANTRIADDPTSTSLYNFVNDIGGPGMSAYTGNVDWIDAVTQNANFNTNNLSVDAGTDKNRFHMGVGYSFDEGLVKHIKYDRITVNVSDEYRINKMFRIGFNFIGSKENLPYNSGALENARRTLPIISDQTKQFYTKNPYGIDSANYNLYSSTPIIQNSETNPLATLEYNWNKRDDSRYSYVGSAFVDINLTKELNFRSTWYANLSNRDLREYTPLYNLYDPSAPADAQIIAKNQLTAVREELTNTKAFQQDYILTWKKKFGDDHSLTATGGFTTYYNSFAQVTGNLSQSQVGINAIPDDPRFWYLSTGFGNQSTLTSSSAQNEYSTVSGLARVLYNYRNKYYLNGSYRKDGASQISQVYDDKFQDFWAVGAAWELSKEDFMQNVQFFDFLKLKASTGLLGNFTAQGKNYPAYPTVSSSASAVFGNNLAPVYTPDYLYDPNLHWEKVYSSEVGVETDVLDNRLHFEATWYKKTTKDLLVLLTPSGILPTLTNGGSIENSGFEFSAGWNQKLKDVTLSIAGNLTTFKNKVLELTYPLLSGSTSEQTPNQSQVGQPIGYFYGLVVEGVYQSYAEISKSPPSFINGGGAKPGDLKYKDVDGSGSVDDKDRTFIGNPTPDFTYGVNVALKYKNFDANLDVAGVYGSEVFRVWGTSEQKNSVYNYPQNYTQGWTAPGTSNFYPIVSQSHLINRAPSTYGIEDGSYFRIRNLSVGYTFGSIDKRYHIKNARLYVSVQNLKTWKNNEGYSPEFAGNATSFGIDFGSAQSALPMISTVGLNVNF